MSTRLRAGLFLGCAAWLCVVAGHAQVRSLRQRLTPAELDARDRGGPGAGTSGVAGIQTTVLHGDPTRAGLYTILLRIPAQTRIEAHTHPDDRVATVISGTWYLGYGDHFDERELRELPAGSFYTEPPGDPHFARTGATAAVVEITGYGPTGTTYVERAGR